MKNFVKFTPRIMTLEFPNAGKDFGSKTCISNGLYCLIQPKDKED